MEITWYGRACFRLKGKDATVITDPCPPSTGFVAGKHDVELLTISHAHPDHSYTRSITAGLTLTRPGEYEFHDLLVTGIRTFHDGEAGGSRGENMVFAVEIDGVHICHLGDLGHLLTDEQLTELGPVDVLLVPVGGETTLTPAEAAEVVAQIGPKIVIPMHFAVDGGIEGPPVAPTSSSTRWPPSRSASPRPRSPSARCPTRPRSSSSRPAAAPPD